MKPQKIKNTELGLNLNYWKGERKNERVFLGKEIMDQLGYPGGNRTLENYELEEGVDKIIVRKREYSEFFKTLVNNNLIGQRAPSVIMLYESGVWKLIMKSKKPIGVKTRNWLAREVLPSIRQKGYYDVKESEDNPFSFLHNFTELPKQKSNSKYVAKKAKEEELSYSQTFNEIHKLVLNKTAKEIKEQFHSKDSARETLRRELPHVACTESFIDEVFTKYNKSIEEIRSTGLQNTLPPAFESIYKLGIDPFND